MKSTTSRIISTGVLAFALGTAATAGHAAASTDTTEPATGISAAPTDMAPGCAEIVGLLDAQYGMTTAYLNAAGGALSALLGSLPSLAAAAQAAAPADIAETVTEWAVPLSEVVVLLEGVDLTDIEAVTATLSSIPPNDAFQEAQTSVETWAGENCGWSNAFEDPFADAPEPPECDVLDPAVAATAAGIEVDTSDADGGGDISLPGYWQKSCSYDNGSMTISTISFNDLDAATAFFAENLVNADGTAGEFVDVELGGLPASTLVTNVGGLTSVSVLEATIPFAVAFSGDDVDPAAVVAAAEAVYAALPADPPPPPATETTMVTASTTG